MHRSESTLYFMHVPKTAGTSLHRILELNFRAWRTYTLTYPVADSADLFRRLPRSRRNRFQLVKGHFPYGFHEQLDTQPIYVSFVRDPVSRVISDYHYRCRVSFLPGFDEFRRAGFEFEHYLEHLYTPNLTTLFFAGVGHLRRPVEPMDRLFQRATANLEQFRYVGIVEHFERSIEEMAVALDLRRIAHVRANVTSQEGTRGLTASQRQRIERAECWDREFYQRIVKLREPVGGTRTIHAPGRISSTAAARFHWSGRALRRLAMGSLRIRYGTWPSIRRSAEGLPAR